MFKLNKNIKVKTPDGFKYFSGIQKVYKPFYHWQKSQATYIYDCMNLVSVSGAYMFLFISCDFYCFSPQSIQNVAADAQGIDAYGIDGIHGHW